MNLKPWERPNEYGEEPGDLCCQRSAGEFCHEHDPANYPSEDPEGEGFSFGTVLDFDEHVRQSVMGYAELHELVVDAAEYFLEAGSRVYDLGTSAGSLLRKLVARHRDAFPGVEWIGVDKEERFIDELKTQPTTGVRYVCADIADDFVLSRASVVTAIFTLQFVPIGARAGVVRAVFDGLRDGGAFFLAEKLYSEHARVQDVMTFLYYDFKRRSFTPEEILGKERALRRQMRPLTASGNVKMLKAAGFRAVEPFWRRFNFGGFLCVK